MQPAHPLYGVRAVQALARAAVLLLVLPAPARAQPSPATPTVFYACYVPASGTTYRIKEPNTPQACHSHRHVEFRWTDGAGAIRTGAAAGGDLTGTYPDPTVAGLQGRAVASTPPADRQLLQFDAAGNAWRPGVPSLGGDLAGSLYGATVRALHGRPVASVAPTAGQVLTYDASAQQWAPAELPPVPESQRPRLRVRAVMASGSVPGASTVETVATCPQGTVLTGGGVYTNGADAKVRSSSPSMSLDDILNGRPPHAWVAAVRNDFPPGSLSPSVAVTVFALCASLRFP